jgi:Nucleotidyl transferase AbiEii toxin, Type IV TA system
MGLPSDDKEAVLARLVSILESAKTPYAVIGGVAMQLYTEEPRTTLDLDIALHSYDDLPRAELEAAGFVPEGAHEWSENWRGPSASSAPLKRRIAVQFSARDPMSGVVDHAELSSVGSFSVRLVALPDLVLLKLAAAEDPHRRGSKRIHDKADVVRLLEEHPELDSSEIRARLNGIRL